MNEHTITTRFAVGDDVALAVHADHPERGSAQLMRVAAISIDIEPAPTGPTIHYYCRAVCRRGYWDSGQDFVIGNRTRAGYLLINESELVLWAEAEAAYKAYKGDGTPEQ